MSSKSYTAALVAPFSQGALGAQIPDIFSYPTDTKHFRQTFSIRLDKNGAFEGCIMPSPVFSLMAPAQWTTSHTAGPSGLIYGGFQTIQVAPNGIHPATVPGATLSDPVTQDLFLNSVQVNSCCSSTTMANAFSQFRVVGWGWKIRALTNLNNTQGRIQFASIPAPRIVPPLALFSPIWQAGSSEPNRQKAYWPLYDAYTALYGSYGGVNSRLAAVQGYLVGNYADGYVPGGVGGSLLNYPLNCEVTSIQLSSAPLKGHGKLMSREFESFRVAQEYMGVEVSVNDGEDADNAAIVFDGWVHQANYSGAGILDLPLSSQGAYGSSAKNGSGGMSNDCRGWNCVPFSVIGGTPDAVAFEIEVVYHVEGLNPLSFTSTTQLSGPMGGVACHHNPVLAMAAETANAASGMFII